MKKILFVCGILFCGANFAFGAPSMTVLPPSGDACTGPGCGKSYPSGGPIEKKLCEDKEAGDACTSLPTGAVKAQCIDNKEEKTGEEKVSCAAKECKPDWLLWFHKNKKGKYVPYGRCREKAWLQKTYCDTDCTCPDGSRCFVIERDIPAEFASGRGGKAFFDQDLCGCVKQSCKERFKAGSEELKCCELEEKGVKVEMKGGSCVCKDDNQELKDGKCEDKKKPGPKPNPKEKNCYYTFTGYHRCNDGRRVVQQKQYKVDSEMMEKIGIGDCDELKDLTEADTVKFNKLVAELCKDSNNTTVDESIDAAARIDAFMRSAELNTSVWKNAEGKFNTARLASDATAGVVLGTVGGIVSANVIKKKQLEKGFDALNCSVGGQKVADWGDEFSVGMHRY